VRRSTSGFIPLTATASKLFIVASRRARPGLDVLVGKALPCMTTHPTTSETTSKPRAQPAIAIPLAHIVSRSSGAIRLLHNGMSCSAMAHVCCWRIATSDNDYFVTSRPKLDLAARWVGVHSHPGRAQGRPGQPRTSRPRLVQQPPGPCRSIATGSSRPLIGPGRLPAAAGPGTSAAFRRFPVGKGGAAHADRLGRIPDP